MKAKINLIIFVFAIIFQASVGVTAAPRTFPVLSVDMGSGCAISVVDYYHGRLKSGMPANASYWADTPPVLNILGAFGINFECHENQKTSDVASQYEARWDEIKKQWIPYFEDEREKKLAQHVSHIYQLQSQNALGFLRTTDQINGEESQRVRFYSYCLFRAEKVVCGDGQSMRLEDPKGDYLPYILRILRSVKFIDDQAGKNNR